VRSGRARSRANGRASIRNPVILGLLATVGCASPDPTSSSNSTPCQGEACPVGGSSGVGSGGASSLSSGGIVRAARACWQTPAGGAGKNGDPLVTGGGRRLPVLGMQRIGLTMVPDQRGCGGSGRDCAVDRSHGCTPSARSALRDRRHHVLGQHRNTVGQHHVPAGRLKRHAHCIHPGRNHLHRFRFELSLRNRRQGHSSVREVNQAFGLRARPSIRAPVRG
jgi:hypothetical protein